MKSARERQEQVLRLTIPKLKKTFGPRSLRMTSLVDELKNNNRKSSLRLKNGYFQDDNSVGVRAG